ncbi:hypothetical protein JTB14_013706 [Gonioctena quinquepunctata]|nr:hypothetical protein JTB14_013706 [Gonioctena quinquepunctata]
MFFAINAINLELASDLSSEAFLAALHRFISLRGRCTELFSDNATNFTGAYRVLFNGLSGTGIKSVKMYLFKILDGHTLTYEELYTTLVQVEAILNSRPLYAMSSDPNDFGVITPGHFLTLEPLTAVSEPDLSHLKVTHLDSGNFC